MRDRASTIAFVLCFVIFVAGLIQLLRLRYEGGDVYPAYSSLRADPLGAMALFEALSRLPDITTDRDFSANNRLPEGRGTTYLHLGAKSSDWEWMSDEEFRTIEDFVTAGGRLVVTFFPEFTKRISIFPRDEENSSDKTDKQEGEKKPVPARPGKKKSGKSRLDRIRHRNSLKERWGIEVGFLELDRGTNRYESVLVQRQRDLALPERLEWHSAIMFTHLSTNWQTIYARGQTPVLVERKLGAGTVVMASDSYFISNEAMLNDRHPDLLCWTIGPSHQVVFDEAHFGILETEGVATLLRKYHLHAVIGALLLVAILFIWKNAVSFVPPWQTIRAHQFVAGRETSAGFINLLRRNIPSRDLLQVCFAEWKKSVTKPGAALSPRQAQAEAIFKTELERRASDRQPLAAYQEICRTLKKL